MFKLAMVRDIHLNPWDAANYYGVIEHGIELYLCGRGDVDWGTLARLYPKAHLVNYQSLDRLWEVLDLEADVIDVPDAHYGFSQYLVKRHNYVVVVAWDNLPGKNSLDRAAMVCLDRAWKHVARSKMARSSLIWDGVPADRIRIIYGAVDTDFFKPDDQPRERAVFFAGRLMIEKGLQDLIWAMKDVDAQLWVAGEGQERPVFEQWASLAGLDVRWLGFLSRDELAQTYRRAKVFCVPSLPKIDADPYATWLEQFGQVFVEAMASGTPIVSTLSGAIPEVVGGAGLLVAPRDWPALSQKITALLDGTRWDKLSQAARDRAEKKFGQDVIAEQIVRWYFG